MCWLLFRIRRIYRSTSGCAGRGALLTGRYCGDLLLVERGAKQTWSKELYIGRSRGTCPTSYTWQKWHHEFDSWSIGWVPGRRVACGIVVQLAAQERAAGPYTAAQASAGRAAYQANCAVLASCTRTDSRDARGRNWPAAPL